MCSIIGYVSNLPIKKYVLDGLMRLEYRGYDSAGVAIIDARTQEIQSLKVVGGVKDLVRADHAVLFDGHIGVGHTRWATHGKQTIENAHPHFDCSRTISIVHNGIIENYAHLYAQLVQKKHCFVSQTDTEAIAHLLEDLLSDRSITVEQALARLVEQLEGMFALVILVAERPETLFFVRKGSPLCIGLGSKFISIASDILAFPAEVTEVITVPDLIYGWMTQSQVNLFNFDGTICNSEHLYTKFSYTHTASAQGNYEHYMLKEIYEQPLAIARTVAYMQSLSDDKLWKKISSKNAYLFDGKHIVEHISSIKLIACGGSWHAAGIGQFFFETIAHIQSTVHLASEYRYMPFFYDASGFYIFLSQSGETADTLEALRMVNQFESMTLGISNVSSSTLVRECTDALITQAGPEIAVASTKAFSTQLVMLYLLAYRIGYTKGIVSAAEIERAYKEVMHASVVLEQSLSKYKSVIMHTYAAYYSQYKTVICLGKNISYPFAMEAALKMKEIPYIFAQCYPAGELKHGPLALVDNQTPVFVFSVLDEMIYKKLINSVHAAKARGAHIVAFGFIGQNELHALADTWFEIEPVAPLLAPLAMVGLMQFFVYEVARYLKLPIDKPRNLAKSVTVE